MASTHPSTMSSLQKLKKMLIQERISYPRAATKVSYKKILLQRKKATQWRRTLETIKLSHL